MHQLQFQVRKLQEKIDALSAENIKLRNADENVKNNLKKYFSTSQVQCMYDGKPVTRWTAEDIAKSLTLRCVSHKAYRFLREKWQLPLPSDSTLNRWVKNFEIEPGILESVIGLLKAQAESMTEQERICCLSFDECSVAKVWSYDKSSDRIYAPHKNVQCIMLRGLCAPWKQIIFYDFDCPLEKELLYSLICRVEDAGFPVVACVSDLGATNVRLWKTLDISPQKPYFTHPTSSDREVYVFADAPHLMKLIRNNFLDYGFRLSNGTFVTSKCIRELITASKCDFKVTHKLSAKHIHVEGANRMNVKLAVQLLSSTTGKSVKYFGEKNLLDKDWKSTSNFILLADAWFDLFNSRVKFDQKPSRNAYGTDLEKQNMVLSKMIETIKSMEVCSKKKKFQFQKGILISCNALPRLYEMLKEKYGVSYLMTNRLSQDGLEHFFGCLRKMGGLCDHPHPVQVKQRLRVHVLGKQESLDFTSKENHGKFLSEATFSGMKSETMVHQPQGSDCNLQEELTLSAMLFASMNLENFENNDENDETESLVKRLEEAIEEEGDQYFAGFVAQKFPEYKFGQKIQRVEKNKSLLHEVSWENSRLTQPSREFLKKLELLGRLFNCYHVEHTLKPGIGAIKKLAQDMCEFVDLPSEVVTFYVTCRTFFRMRILNRNLAVSNKKYKVFHHLHY